MEHVSIMYKYILLARIICEKERWSKFPEQRGKFACPLNRWWGKNWKNWELVKKNIRFINQSKDSILI